LHGARAVGGLTDNAKVPSQLDCCLNERPQIGVVIDDEQRGRAGVAFVGDG
jgi:hypothetical protein